MSTSTQAPTAALPPIEAFVAGRHIDSQGTAREWTDADLRELAETYDPALSEAPICIGHPKGNAPAFGWVGKLATDGRALQALPSTAQPEFQDWVKRKLFKKVSISIYGREHPANPTPGRLYLRHVGFLGAQPPAIKGLADYSFADAADEHVIEFADYNFGTVASMFRSLREWVIAQFGADAADKALPGWSIDSLASAAAQPETDSTTRPAMAYSEGAPAMAIADTTAADLAALAAREATLAAERTALDTRSADLARREALARTAEFAEFTGALVREGRLLPKDSARLVAVLGALPEATVLEFAEGDTPVSKPALTALREFLSGLPKQVDFSERAAPTAKPSQVDTTDGVDIARTALQFQEAEAKAGRTVSTEAAVQYVMDQNEGSTQ